MLTGWLPDTLTHGSFLRWPGGPLKDDLKGKNAQFVNPKFFAEKVAAADEVVSP